MAERDKKTFSRPLKGALFFLFTLFAVETADYYHPSADAGVRCLCIAPPGLALLITPFTQGLPTPACTNAAQAGAPVTHLGTMRREGGAP